MKLCHKQGNGVCLGCPQIPPRGHGDVCRYKAEDLLDCLQEIINTEWTQEQTEVFVDFEITKQND
jgi:hypothetical protein